MVNSSTKRTKDAAIYREAARRLETFECMAGCCRAISEARGTAGRDDYMTEHHLRAEAVFDYMGKNQFGWRDADSLDRRVLAMCFMAAMVEAGDA